MSSEFKISIQFLAELDQVRQAVPAIKGVFQQLMGAAREVGVETVTSAKGAGAALKEQLGQPAKEVTKDFKGMAQESGKAASAVEATGKALKKVGEEGKAAVAGASHAVGRLAADSQGLGTSLGSLVRTLGLAYAGVLLLRQGFAFLKEGIGFSSQMETAQLGIASLVAAQATLTDATGKELKGREALNAALAISSDQMQKLKIAGLETVATTEQLVVAYQQAVGVGLAAGMNLDQIREITIKITQAAAALGVPMNQLAEEVRDLLQGNINPRNTRIATALGITNEEVRKWRAAGGSTLADELNKRMEAFGLAGDLAAKTWQGVTSNVMEATQTLAGEMSKPLFTQLKEGLQDTLEQVLDLKNGRISDAFTGLLDSGRDGFEALGTVSREALASIVGGLKDVSAWLQANRAEVGRAIAAATTVAEVVGTILAGAFRALGTILEGLSNLLGNYPTLLFGVIGALGALAVANSVAALSFSGVATAATSAAIAVKAFFVSLGPVGWAIALIGTLGGVALGLRAARQAEAREAEATARRMRQETETAGVLVSRYASLNAELSKGTQTLAGRIQVEKQLETVRQELIRLGGAFAQIVESENGNRPRTIELLRKEVEQREKVNAARRAELTLAMGNMQADIQRQRRRISLMDQGRMPDTGEVMSAAQRSVAAQDWYSREVAQLKELEGKYNHLKAMLDGLGPESHALTLAQMKERKAELEKLIPSMVNLQKEALAGPGDEAATKAFTERQERLQQLRAELAEIDKALDSPVKVTGKPVVPDDKHKKTLIDPEEVAARLAKYEAESSSKATMEEEKKAKILTLQAETRKKTADLDKEMADGKYKGREDLYWAQMEGLGREYAAKRIQIDRDTAKARGDLEADLTARVGAQEEGGLAKREEAVRKFFQKVREDNEKLKQDGKTFLSDDQIVSAESAAKARERIAQVKADLQEINREMAEKAQQLGRGLNTQEQTEILGRYKAKGGTGAEAAGQKEKDLGIGRTGGEGFGASVDTFLATSRNAFQIWKDFGSTVINGLAGSFSGFFESMTQRGQTFAQKTRALWQGISGSVIKALADMMAKHVALWTLEKAKLAWDAIKSGMQSADTAKTISQNTAKQASNTSTASTGFFASFAGLGPWGFALAVAAIVAMFAFLKGVTGRKVGGLVGENGPEMTLLGEEGLEVVAPEKDFKDWAKGMVGMGATLQANLTREQRQVQGYQRQGTDYAAAASQPQQDGGAATGGGGVLRSPNGGRLLVANFALSGIFAGSLDGRRAVQTMVKSALRDLGGAEG